MDDVAINRVVCTRDAERRWTRSYDTGDDVDLIRPEHRTAVAMLDAAGVDKVEDNTTVAIKDVGTRYCSSLHHLRIAPTICFYYYLETP